MVGTFSALRCSDPVKPTERRYLGELMSEPAEHNPDQAPNVVIIGAGPGRV